MSLNIKWKEYRIESNNKLKSLN